MKFEYLINKSLVLILWELTDDGGHDVKMFPGTLVHRADTYYLDLGEREKSHRIPEDWLDNIAEVPPELKPLMKNCDYQLSLTAGDILEVGKSFEEFGLE
ncbi:MAG TPA: hypothetical protein VFK12_10335 [Gammaproteobacteria bacterium]|nr:hypothetical protein [Gammaproteobacteria bacterium]